MGRTVIILTVLRSFTSAIWKSGSLWTRAKKGVARVEAFGLLSHYRIVTVIKTHDVQSDGMDSFY